MLQERNEAEAALAAARLFIAETGVRLNNVMYDDPRNREGLAYDCKAVAGDEVNMRYLDVKWQTDRAIKAERERDACRADAERFVWWFSDTPKSNEYINEYLRGVRRHWTLDIWRSSIDGARAPGAAK
jgi:hypothetical protein